MLLFLLLNFELARVDRLFKGHLYIDTFHGHPDKLGKHEDCLELVCDGVLACRLMLPKRQRSNTKGGLCEIVVVPVLDYFKTQLLLLKVLDNEGKLLRVLVQIIGGKAAMDGVAFLAVLASSFEPHIGVISQEVLSPHEHHFQGSLWHRGHSIVLHDACAEAARIEQLERVIHEFLQCPVQTQSGTRQGQDVHAKERLQVHVHKGYLQQADGHTTHTRYCLHQGLHSNAGVDLDLHVANLQGHIQPEQAKLEEHADIKLSIRAPHDRGLQHHFIVWCVIALNAPQLQGKLPKSEVLAFDPLSCRLVHLLVCHTLCAERDVLNKRNLLLFQHGLNNLLANVQTHPYPRLGDVRPQD
mmetsp:Transcript_20672/g.57683  ORF Transcript_20672/g.57683 Transcript_20672/m.57683 type:complete len:355 (+) Transcript_20672:1483-2547(+)